MTGMRAGCVGLVALIALSAAGCGGGQDPPSVASLGGSGAGTTGGSGSPAPDVPQLGGSFVTKPQNGLAFAHCMRSHGVPDFPDPNSRGAIEIGPGSGIDPRSRKLQAAQKACQALLPNGRRLSPRQLAKALRGAIAHSACMRKHGVPDFPDPTVSGGNIGISIRGRPGSDLDPSSPAFQAAQRACQWPPRPGGTSSSAGGG